MGRVEEQQEVFTAESIPLPQIFYVFFAVQINQRPPLKTLHVTFYLPAYRGGSAALQAHGWAPMRLAANRKGRGGELWLILSVHFHTAHCTIMEVKLPTWEMGRWDCTVYRLRLCVVTQDSKCQHVFCRALNPKLECSSRTKQTTFKEQL